MEKKKNEHFVYILKCKDGTLYTGYTTDIERRLLMHENGKGAKYTRGRGPFEIVYNRSFPTKQEALKEEYRVKRLPRRKKETLINLVKEGQDKY